MTVEDESTDLKLHAHLCAERYKGIGDQFQRFEQRMDSLENKMDTLHKDFVEANKSMRSTIITTFGSVLVALIGLISLLFAR